MIPYFGLIYWLLYEKETKIKEYMKIMGLTDSSYYASWVFYYEIVFLIIGLVQTFFLKKAMFYSSSFLMVLL